MNDKSNTQAQGISDSIAEYVIQAPQVKIRTSPRDQIEQVNSIFSQRESPTIQFSQGNTIRTKSKLEHIKPMILPNIRSKLKKSKLTLLSSDAKKFRVAIRQSLKSRGVRVISPLPSRKFVSQMRSSIRKSSNKDHRLSPSLKRVPFIIGQKIKIEEHLKSKLKYSDIID